MVISIASLLQGHYTSFRPGIHVLQGKQVFGWWAFFPAPEPGQEGVHLVVGAARLMIPVPGCLDPLLGAEAEAFLVAGAVLRAQVAVTAAALGQDLLELAMAQGAGAMGPIPLALARPLALVAGEVVGGETGAFRASIRPKQGLQHFGQGDLVFVAHGTVALAALVAGWRATQIAD